MKKLLAGGALLFALGTGHAAPISVDVSAQANSSTGGVGKPAFSVVAGEIFTVSVSPTDLWSAGALPRWSNADGLIANLLATGSDESLQPAGTLIGQDFGLLVLHGLAAPFGALVGEIAGDYELLGTDFSGPAWATGNLNLYYWDQNNGDNSGFITARLDKLTASVPEPGILALLAVGIAGLTFRSRRGLRG